MPTHRIAIVVPQAVSAVVGGAENLWAGLIENLNRMQGISAQLVGLPSHEKTLPEILETYAAFAQLDLSGFDQVISTKYPAWAIQHPNHTVYLQHTLRGLYDTYPESLGYALAQPRSNCSPKHCQPLFLNRLLQPLQKPGVPLFASRWRMTVSLNMAALRKWLGLCLW